MTAASAAAGAKPASAYLRGLHEQLACLATLRELLAHEQSALSGHRFDELQTIGARKESLLNHLAALDRDREAAQRAAGFGPGRAGADAMAATEGPATCQAWSDLLSQAALARADNLRTGSAVHAHLDFTQKALNFLQASTQLFYGPDGARRSTALGGGTRLAAG